MSLTWISHEPAKLERTTAINENASPFGRLFEECFHLHFEGLHRYAFTILNDNDHASDVVQTVFANWWEGREKLTLQQEPRHYLYTAVRNRCINHLRDKKNRRTMVVDFGAGTDVKEHRVPADPVLNKELGEHIRRAIDALPPQCRLIFMKSRFEEMKYAEIAQEMNLSIKTVEAQIGKALKILREQLSEKGYVILLLITWSIFLKQVTT